VANHRGQTGLDSIAASPPGWPHLPAPGPRSSPRLPSDLRGLWSTPKGLVLIILWRKITGLFSAIPSVRPCTFASGFQGGKARPIVLPADGLRIY